MTLSAFMLASEAVRLEEGVRFQTKAGAAPEPSPSDMRQRNAESMQLLQGMMAGVKGAPRVAR